MAALLARAARDRSAADAPVNLASAPPCPQRSRPVRGIQASTSATKAATAAAARSARNREARRARSRARESMVDAAALQQHMMRGLNLSLGQPSGGCAESGARAWMPASAPADRLAMLFVARQK